MVLNGSGVNDGRRWFISSLLYETCDSECGSRRVWFVEATVVILHVGVTTGSIAEIVDAEGVWLDLSTRDCSCMISLKDSSFWDASH